MLAGRNDYATVRSDFVWDVPDYFNIGVDVCDKWADDPDRLALMYRRRDGSRRDYSFAQLKRLSNRFANVMRRHGIRRGDRVGILLPQSPETAVAHIATYKMGGIAVPLFTLFGVEALEYRLGNCAAKALVTDQEGARKIAEIRDLLPALEYVYVIDGAPDGCFDFKALSAEASDEFEPVKTRADEPALIIYTSGTTGQPKGALHAHRVLLGHLPGVEMSHDFFPQDGDVMWTPADWAWIGGLLDVLLPAWHHGKPVVAHRFEKFSAEAAFELIAEYGVRNTFLPPTALKMMRAAGDDVAAKFKCNIRSIASGGETLGAELLDWGRRVFGVTINEFYGQTECNMIVSSCQSIMAPKPGVMGRPVPGHNVAVIDIHGNVLPIGEMGKIAVKAPDPVMFLEYWRNPDATRDKYIGEWLLTGDIGQFDEDGYIRFVGRDDDLISSAGYRIGPGEIEDCLIGHPAVRMAGVIGKPDEQRGQIVKAFIVLVDGFAQSPELEAEIRNFVKTRLAAHEYPREIAFMEQLPMTTTGKVVRRALRDIA
ncbi:acyl-CoA synthetase [Thalassospira alkalitolerans]|uniref:AMP-dependent synthetase n=1 Tax=Thalassospira alkalitolerans TaxID=1293890 RepID=A0A1Y2LFF9_9PROT|nr:acyl-CoA synthetase [Thalassospira alkalitolerans]OSQ49952.1 AMP-dependent synthetase [Thalassospira alkalitolerans]|tara:strand:- start:13060 stop:14676 length:1617 start_codon:yes stop_codon:yes gene_type:complete